MQSLHQAAVRRSNLRRIAVRFTALWHGALCCVAVSALGCLAMHQVMARYAACAVACGVAMCFDTLRCGAAKNHCGAAMW